MRSPVLLPQDPLQDTLTEMRPDRNEVFLLKRNEILMRSILMRSLCLPNIDRHNEVCQLSSKVSM
jgi:hypothetical protein